MNLVGRVRLIDTVRGISLLMMLLYHLFVDYCTMGLLPYAILNTFFFRFIQIASSCTFILLAGISCRFSKNNLKRALKMLGGAAVISLVSLVVSPDLFIVFGVLHFLGTATLLWHFVGDRFDRLPAALCPVLCVPLFFATWQLLHRTFAVRGLWIFGIRSASFRSADYFPLMPYIFLFLFGAWVGRYIAEGRFPMWFYRWGCPLLEKAGKHTLFIYLVHQPIFYGLVLLVYLFI